MSVCEISPLQDFVRARRLRLERTHTGWDLFYVEPRPSVREWLLATFGIESAALIAASAIATAKRVPLDIIGGADDEW